MVTAATESRIRAARGGEQSSPQRPLSRFARRKALGDTVRAWLVDGDDRAVIRKAAMGESAGNTGGYLVPEELQIGVDMLLAEYSLFHRHGWLQPMKTATCSFPAFDLTASHATGATPLVGGFNLTWFSEASSLTESKPQFSSGTLVSRNLGAVCIASNQLIQDGGAPLGAYLEQGFAKAIAHAVEYACFQGNGVTQPMGIINSPATVLVSRASGSDVTRADVANMSKSLFPACAAHAWWACNPSVLAKLAALSDFQITQPTGWDSRGPSGLRLAGVLAGCPLMVTEKLPALGTKGDLVLFDPRMYVLGFRSLTIDRSDQDPIYFLNYQTVLRVVWRGDGQPLPRGTFTIADGATTCGCFVALQA